MPDNTSRALGIYHHRILRGLLGKKRIYLTKQATGVFAKKLANPVHSCRAKVLLQLETWQGNSHNQLTVKDGYRHLTQYKWDWAGGGGLSSTQTQTPQSLQVKKNRRVTQKVNVIMPFATNHTETKMKPSTALEEVSLITSYCSDEGGIQPPQYLLVGQNSRVEKIPSVHSNNCHCRHCTGPQQEVFH